jgi:hypothetical protein
MIKAIMIDPFAISVRPFELPDPRERDQWECLAAMYAALSHSTLVVDTIDAVRLRSGYRVSDFLIVDGNGRIRHDVSQRWFAVPGVHHETLAGKGLIIGGDEEGCECSTTFKVSDVWSRAYFFHAAGGHLIQTRRPWVAR